jgi:hypothetical protein
MNHHLVSGEERYKNRKREDNRKVTLPFHSSLSTSFNNTLYDDMPHS